VVWQFLGLYDTLRAFWYHSTDYINTHVPEESAKISEVMVLFSCTGGWFFVSISAIQLVTKNYCTAVVMYTLTLVHKPSVRSSGCWPWGSLPGSGWGWGPKQIVKSLLNLRAIKTFKALSQPYYQSTVHIYIYKYILRSFIMHS